jgi:hypothetical protein
MALTQSADAGSAPAGVMRVQLQQQSGGRTIHHASQVLREAGGVSVDQVTAALRQLRKQVRIPRRELAGADAALARAVRWVEDRPPTGVSGRFSKSFYFDPRSPWASWRFDVEGVSGYNLMR